MAIHKTSTGWSIKLMRKGHRFSDFVLGPENYAEAQAIELRALADMSSGLRPSGGTLKHGTSLTLQYAFDETWEQSWQGASKGYQAKVLQYWRSLKEYFIDQRKMVRLDAIDTKAIDDYVKVLRAKGNKPKTVNNKLNCLSSMLTLMTERRLLKAVPVLHWEKVKNNSRPRYFSPEEELEILGLASTMRFHAGWINEALTDFIILLADTGMRPWSEAHALRVSWIVTNSMGIKVIRIPAEVCKTDTERELPITPRLAQVLDKYVRRLGKGERLFEGLDYKWHCVAFWDSLVRPTMGWGATEVWYCFRHTFATRLCEYDVNLKVVQSLMGHSCITQTARYAKATDTAKSNAIQALEQGRLNALDASQTNGTQTGNQTVGKSVGKRSHTQLQMVKPLGLTH